MNEAYDMPYTLRRPPEPLIRFIIRMRRRGPYKCPQCRTLWSGLYKPVGMCPVCGRFVKGTAG